MIENIYKMHFKEIDIKNNVNNCCFNYLIKAKKLETKAILFDEKS